VSAHPWRVVSAPAKVNLFLEVLARRDDGYHELDTLMLAVDLCDEVRARRSSGGAVTCRVDGPQASRDVPTDERNLAVRAAAAVLDLARRAGRATASDGVELELHKRIPSQAGLGGASSDAAAAFEAVEQAFEWRCESELASRTLAELGSDCVFFRTAATSGRARCTGRGELVAVWPALERELGILLVTPDLGASTALVYRSLGDPLSWRDDRRRLETCFSPATRSAPEHEAHPQALVLTFNRLEDAACHAVEGLGHWREALRSIPVGAWRLSGSGASFFALFDSQAGAQAARERVARELAARGLAPRGIWALRPFRVAAPRAK
jgi:4-diphosphocytidyl-2-C-methyl-D-erythritol kinase